MKRLAEALLALLVLFLFLLAPAAAQTPTQVWGLYGWGDNWHGTSSGVDEIAEQARTIPGVQFVHVHNYWETQIVYDAILAAPPDVKIAIYGYSCGNNALPVIAKGLNGQRMVDTLAGIQMSLWCGGDDVTPNVIFAQTTYGKCTQTLGLGCKKFRAADGNTTSQILNISRPERHGAADNDPEYQQDVLNAIAETAMVPPEGAGGWEFFGHGHWLARRGFATIAKGAAMFKKGVHEIQCYHGEC
jgi:hypothetical protein